MPVWAKIPLGFAITAVFVAFVILLVETVYKGPKYENFVNPRPYPAEEINDEARCIELGGKWNADDGSFPKPARPPVPAGGEPTTPMGWCDLNYESNQKWEHARNVHDGIAAGIYTLVGLVVLFVSIHVSEQFRRLTPFSEIFAIGGVVLLIVSIVRYSPHMNEYLRLIGVGLLLLLLAGIAFWLLWRESKRRKNTV